MKILRTVAGLFVFISLCHAEEIIQGKDVYCAPAKSVSTCEQLSGCQSAFAASVDDEEPKFSACVANSNFEHKSSSSDEFGFQDSPLEVPTLDEAFDNKCADLDENFLFAKKVKVCHSTSEGSSHTILVDCSSLREHSKHHDRDDYIGACAKH